MMGRMSSSRLVGLVSSLCLLVRARALLDCEKFEGYSQCGDPEKEFRHPDSDRGCQTAIKIAGYCVCTSEGCTEPANKIRIPIQCAPEWEYTPVITGSWASSTPGDDSRNCSAICRKHSSEQWLAGVAASVGASISTATGLIVQKAAQTRHQALPEDMRPPMLFGFIMAPLWVMGFLLLVLVPLPFNLMAVTWAAASLVAPLASVTLVINQILAPCTLGETLTRTDVLATAVIVVGVVMATVFGSHCESSYEPEDLLGLYAKIPFLVVAAVIISAMIVSYVSVTKWRASLGDNITTEQLHKMGMAPNSVCVSYAFLAGSMGALMQIVFKGIGELVGAGAFGHWALWVFIPIMVVMATGQMAFLNQGMAVCNAVMFFPCYNACLIVMMTISGMIYYEEYMQLDGVKGWSFFVAGVLMVILGVLLLTRKSSSDGPHNSQVAPLEGELEGAEAGAAGGMARVRSHDSGPNTPERRLSFSVPVSESGRPLALGIGFVDPRPSSHPPSPTPGPGSRGPTPPLIGVPVAAQVVVPPSDLGGQRGGGHSGAARRSPRRLASIAGGGTPLASMTAEDAQAFLALQKQRPDLMARAGLMTQEELMNEVSRKLESIGEPSSAAPDNGNGGEHEGEGGGDGGGESRPPEPEPEIDHGAQP